MRKSAVLAALVLVSATSWAGDGLTPTETRWIDAAGPVLDYAAAQGLPIDIIVQPQAGPNDVPLAMGFDGGRCQLVLTLRGNPNAEDSLKSLNSGRKALAIEAMAAHEVAHCWRRIAGDWNTLPAGFVSPPAMTRQERMEQTRREEGLADLFGLAWMQARHPAEYAQIHAWFESVREDEVVPGSHHDTRQWIEMVRNPAVFEGAGKLPFEQAKTLWARSLD